VITKIGFGSPKCRHFLMCTMHQLAVPEEAKQEDETKRCNECDEEFFPVHNLFRLRLLLSPRSPETFIAKCVINVDVNFSRLTAYENDEARMTNVERSPNAQMTKRQNAWFVIRTSSFLRHWTFVIAFDSTYNPSSRKRPTSTSAAGFFAVRSLSP
jgi:hypothetical protein